MISTVVKWSWNGSSLTIDFTIVRVLLNAEMNICFHCVVSDACFLCECFTIEWESCGDKRPGSGLQSADIPHYLSVNTIC